MSLCVTYLDNFESSARLLASKLNLPLLDYEEATNNDRLILVVSDLGLAVQQSGKNTPGPIRCNFSGGAVNHRRLYGGGRNQDIAKAVGIGSSSSKLLVMDLTAGLGRDGFVLASLGATVLMIERNPVVSALLGDGLARARKTSADNGVDLEKILKRISHISTDAVQYLK